MTTNKTAISLCLCIFLLTLSASVFMVATEIAATVQEYGKLPTGLIAAVDALPAQIVAPLLNVVDKHATRIENKVDGRLASIQGDIRALGSQVVTAADTRVGDTLARADAAIGQIREIRGDLRPTLENAAAITGNVATITASDNIPGAIRDTRFFLARAARTAGHIEQASDEARLFFPKAVVNFQSIGANVDGITGNVKRLTTPRWYDRVLGYGLSAGTMYRDLNPGFNAGQAIRGIFVKHQ